MSPSHRITPKPNTGQQQSELQAGNGASWRRGPRWDELSPLLALRAGGSCGKASEPPPIPPNLFTPATGHWPEATPRHQIPRSDPWRCSSAERSERKAQRGGGRSHSRICCRWPQLPANKTHRAEEAPLRGFGSFAASSGNLRLYLPVPRPYQEGLS